MYIEDLKRDFYNVITGERLLLLVNFDIDSICACKILQYLFRCDNVVYTLVPIQGISDLKNAYNENRCEVKYVLFINCGGNIDIVELLEPDEDVVFFVADNHRPTDVCNVYSNGQVRLLMQPTSDEGIPNFDDIFRDDESENEEEGEDDEDEEGEDDEERVESARQKRMRMSEEAILKRREKRAWEESRHRILFEYTQFSYYGQSCAVLMFELAWKLSKDNHDLIWWAIVGATEQLILGKVENQHYVLESGNLQNHVSRLSHQNNTEANTQNTGVKITFDKDLRLALYRHWTVEASVKHTMYTACKLKLWTLRGEKRLNELLAEMGLPLVQSRQKFSAMDLVLRKEFQTSLEKVSEKYGLTNIVYASFVLQYGFRSRFCAADVVYAMLALLEGTGKTKAASDCFLDALDCLSRSQKDILSSGIEKAKKLLECIFKQVQTSLDMSQVLSAGPFLYLVIQEGALDSACFSNPHCLSLLAHFALRAHVAISRSRRAPNLPLVISAPLDHAEGTCLILGIPPVSEDSPRNFFGKAFEQAAEKTNSRAVFDYFDTSCMQLKCEDRSKFFDALTSLLS
ncbi:cell division control protein 45 homolog [Ischnura elegans]|uniref:cell division control protein 45 homolog n=1 Tax=Ischnura elegans TaxID=197161 RepID=UPI001ED89C61|nr:cell division control protein 45 homolog [Ischnura elegans]